MNSRPDTPDPKQAFEQLSTLGVLPPNAEFVTYANAESPATGLLATWKEWLRLAPKSRRSRAARIHSGLTAAIAAGAELTFSLRNRDQQLCEKWLGRRAYWWPKGIVDSACVGIVSSRLQREASIKTTVLRALRLSMSAVDPASERIVASVGTTLCEYIEHCSKILDLPLLRVSTPGGQANSKQWIEELIRAPGSDNDVDLRVSPSIANNIEPDLFSDLPLRDRVLALLSRWVVVLTIRRGGNWWKLLQAGINDELWQAGTVRAIPGKGLCTDDVMIELQNLGAVRWHLTSPSNLDDHPSSEALPTTDTENTQPKSVTLAYSIPAAEAALIQELVQPEPSTEWLIHWTRAPQGEWAGESRADYLNSILHNEDDDSRTAYGTLERIIHECVIRATAGNTRTGMNTVCLSGTPLTKLVDQRIYRQHRGRWDFEHYGIGIRKKFVHSLGGRPVIYGDESTWESLQEGERSWFQLKESDSTSDSIDWTIEDEWRLTTDLLLGNLPTDGVFVFCATEQEAIKLRNICQWRVVPVEQLTAKCRTTNETDER